MTRKPSSVDASSVPIIVDTDKLNSKDVEGFLPLLDRMPIGSKVYALQLSRQGNEASNNAKLARTGLPYTNIVFVDFDNYIEASPNKMKTILDNFDKNVILFTKDYSLAAALKPKLLGVYVFG